MPVTNVHFSLSCFIRCHESGLTCLKAPPLPFIIWETLSTIRVTPTHYFLFPGAYRQVFVRAGLHHVVLDSPEQADWANVKHPSADFGCPRYKISKPELGNPNFDFRAKRRTAEGVDASIEYASKGGTEAERNKREQRHGVLIPMEPNPLKALTFDRLLQSPFDILHQDALVSTVLYGVSPPLKRPPLCPPPPLSTFSACKHEFFGFPRG